jgi:protein SCO1
MALAGNWVGKERFRKYRTVDEAPWAVVQTRASTLPFGHVPARVRLTLIAALAMLFAAVAVFVAFSGGRQNVSTAGTFAGAQRPPDLRAEPFDGLQDEEGRALSLKRFRGQVVVMTFLYTTCKDTCPLTAQQIRGALDDLGADVPVIAVSVDPANDTRAQAKRFLVEQQMIGRMHFALGDSAALKRQWSAYGIAPQRDGKEHSAYVVLVDGDGMQRIGWPVDKLTPEGLAHDIRKLQDDEV